MTGKEKIIEFCDTVKTHNIDWLERCLMVGASLRKGTNDYLDSCPEAFLDDAVGEGFFLGSCQTEEVPNNEQGEQCKVCWGRALNLTI